MNRSELKSSYLNSVRKGGVYSIVNTAERRMLLGSSMDFNAIFNRHRFNLAHGGHENKTLLADWRRLGVDNFSFDVVDELKPKKEPGYNAAADLSDLLKLWITEYRSQGWNFY